jgi:hypothetical protein
MKNAHRDYNWEDPDFLMRKGKSEEEEYLRNQGYSVDGLEESFSKTEIHDA